MPSLNPQFRNLLLIVAAVLLLASVASYLAPSCRRRADQRQLGQDRASHAQAQQQHQAATTRYRLDSVRYAEAERPLRQQDSLYRQEDAQLSSTRQPFVLPPIEQLPREGASPR